MKRVCISLVRTVEHDFPTGVKSLDPHYSRFNTGILIFLVHVTQVLRTIFSGYFTVFIFPFHNFCPQYLHVVFLKDRNL